jgi:hypothetical protein
MAQLDYKKIKEALEPIPRFAQINVAIISESPLHEDLSRYNSLYRIRAIQLVSTIKSLLNQVPSDEAKPMVKEFLVALEDYIRKESDRTRERLKYSVVKLFDYSIQKMDKIIEKIDALIFDSKGFTRELIYLRNSLKTLNDVHSFMRQGIDTNKTIQDRELLLSLLNSYLSLSNEIHLFVDSIRDARTEESIQIMIKCQISISQLIRRCKAAMGIVPTAPVFSEESRDVANAVLGYT